MPILKGQVEEERKVKGLKRKNKGGTDSWPKKVQKKGNSESGGRLFRRTLGTFLGMKPSIAEEMNETEGRDTEVGTSNVVREKEETAEFSGSSTMCGHEQSTDIPPVSRKSSLTCMHFHLPVHRGLHPSMGSSFNRSTTCILPGHREPLVNALLDGAVGFEGNSMVDQQDLQGLHGRKSGDEEKYLTNFVIEAYLHLTATEGASKGVQVEILGWEQFEKGVGQKLAQDLLKGKASLMEQDIVLVPCNSGQRFLLAVLPHQRQMLILDSKSGAFTKPSAENAIEKMWRLLQEVDSSLDSRKWSFYANIPQDVPQQQNNFDCGVFLCLFARCMVLQSEFPRSDSIFDFRQQMILELHEKELHSFAQPPIQEDHYYAVEYQKSYYFGRALGRPDGGFIDFKFLHSSQSGGAKVFDWPRRDDKDRVHSSCVFYGPVNIMGVGPFAVSQLREVEQVYQWLKKSRKV